MIIDDLKGTALLCKKGGLFNQNFFFNYDSDYNKRLKFVKLIYLFQSLTGINLGYNFIWHIDGPYSKRANGVGYIFQNDEEEYSTEIASKKIEFTESALNKKTSIFCDKIKLFIDSPELMEIAASLEYLNGDNISSDVLTKQLIEKKPKFRGEEIRIKDTINKLKLIRKDINN